MSRVLPSFSSNTSIDTKPIRRRSSLVQSILSRNSSSTLDPTKFSELMSNDLASGFEETSFAFREIANKAAAIMDCLKCYIFLCDEKEHKLFTLLEDEDGNQVKVMKPVDRGITGFVFSEEKAMKEENASSSKFWCSEIDNLESIVTTNYLGSPLWDSMTGTCLGVLEFRNKENALRFDTADEQMSQIIAFQVGRAVIHHRQQELLDGRAKAINMAYEKSFDGNDSIVINNDLEYMQRERSLSTLSSSSGVSSLRKAMRLKQRSAMSLGSSWKWTPSTNHSTLVERDWSYDVFLQSEEQLVMHAVDIFDERGLFTNFSIPVSVFVNFVKEIKAGYNSSAPYHNHYHAFDVMHVCYLLITRCKADDFLDSFNILSILVGALAHDLGHDGFNNAFHCTTNSELAVIYNGISVLENYSAAYLFRILKKEKCNIFARLSDTEMLKMRSRLIDLILDTDAKNHFMLMTRFKHSIEMKQLPRGLLSSMILHVSDVSNPTRPGTIARKWAYAVQEEFFRQGDKEKELQLATSPFMDREYENLPRMQGAFIDALVNPVFKLLAELLPLVASICIKQMHINRSFWNSMQNQNIITTEQIKNYVEEMRDEVAHDQSTINVKDHGGAIPGIPANAHKENGERGNVRKLSLVPLQNPSLNVDDMEQGAPLDTTLDVEVGKVSLCRKMMCNAECVSFKTKLKRFLDSGPMQILLLCSTIYALFGNDLNMIFGGKESDIYFDILTLFVLIVFLIEIILCVICVKKYSHFFLWLDVIASISLLLEINFLLNIESGSAGSLALAKAGRAAKVGARAGRFAKLLRLLRLIRIAKVLKWMMGYRKKKDENTPDEDDEIGMKMSNVGRHMTESITKKVVLTVLLMLVVFSLLETNHIPDARVIQLNALGLNSDSVLLRDGFLQAFQKNLILLEGAGERFHDADSYLDLRNTDILTLVSATNEKVHAAFDMSRENRIDAIFSLLTTTIVTILLAVLSLLFSSDAYKIMIRPIEKMKSTVQKLSENPLLHLEKLKQKEEMIESSETDLLEQTINKMAFLLQVGFGIAGSEIIAKSLSAETGEVDPMIPGLKVEAIFGFCDIRNFTTATEYLKQDVMLFVNKLARITHKHVVDSGGAPNKNIGDAFLLVWKLSTTKDGKRGKLQKHLFDSALSSVLNILEEIKHLGSLADFMHREERSENVDFTCLNNFQIEMGFGLHSGWAIEGSIGSKVKVDASYLSPHVNFASRLESATKLYSIPLLMSDVFVSCLTGSLQSTCRRVDRVVFKGCLEPSTIFHLDIEPFSALVKKPDDYSQLILATSWSGKEEVEESGLDLTKVLKALESDKSLLQREIYENAFNAYLDGYWHKCKLLLHIWLEKFPGDLLVQSLCRTLISHNFTCPDDWKGYRILHSKD